MCVKFGEPVMYSIPGSSKCWDRAEARRGLRGRPAKPAYAWI